MADERIDVVVTDKVDAGVEKKLRGIADAAERGENYLTRLKGALANVNASSVDRLAAAMAKADSAQARLISAQARLTNAQNAGAVAAQKVALGQQKVVTEAARSEAAQQRAASATYAAERAQIALTAAQQRAAGASMQAATGQQQLAGATQMAGAAASGSGNQFRQYVAGIQAANTAAAAGVAPNNALMTAQHGSANAAYAYARAQRGTTAANANIIAQIQDIGVSLAGGQNPLLVAIQQGSQLSYIASTMEGGLKQLIGTIAKMALAWAPVILAVGAAYLAFKSFTSMVNEGANMDGYVKSLGLTRAELKKLEDQHVTMGDTLKATWQVLSQTLLANMGFSTDQIKSFWSDTTNSILKWSVAAFLGIGAGAVTLVKWLAATTKNIAALFYNAGVAAKNLFLISIEGLVNGVVKGLNAIGGVINTLSEKAGMGELVGKFGEVSLGVQNVKDGMLELTHVDLKGTFEEGLQNGLRNLKAIGAQSEANAKARLKAQADELKLDRTPRADRKLREDKTAENRAHAIAQVNLQLDNELSRMKLLKDARAVQQRMDQIEQSLAQKKITLNDAERLSIENKVKAIESYKFVQAELDRIYEDAIGPLRTYQAAQQAITELQAAGAINAQRASQEQVKANRAYMEATDPLFQMKEQLKEAETTSRLYGAAVQEANYYEQIRQQYLAQGIILGQNSTAAIDAEVAALMRRNAALQQQQFIQSTIGGVVDPMMQDQKLLDNKANLYAELDRMAANHTLTEQQHQQARYALDAKFSEMRLQGASNFFGELAGLSASGNSKLAAIGKAAAMAQATMDGYVAVQKALASGPPPWNYLMAAAVAAKTGVQVAGIASTNVGNFATGGQFMVDGKSGVDANNINMNVTRGERVTVETPAQQRATDAGQAGANVNVPVTVVNVRDPSEVYESMGTPEGKRVIFNILRDNANELASIAGGGG